MGRIFPSGGHLVLEEAGRVVWSTALAPVNLLPQASWISLPDYTINWPDFSKNNAYGFDIGKLGVLETSVCASFSTILPQEYASSPISLGTVPAGVNYIAVLIKMYRSKSPSTYLGEAVLTGIKEYATVLLDGGSCQVEAAGPWRRGFNIVLSDTTVLLTVHQSVRDPGNLGIWTPGNATHYPSGGKREGWTHGGANNGHPAYMIESKAGGNINKCRGEGNACSLSDPTDYSIAWRGAITIIPGFIPN